MRRFRGDVEGADLPRWRSSTAGRHGRYGRAEFRHRGSGHAAGRAPEDRLAALLGEEPRLAGELATVVGEPAARADDPVTGQDDGDRVGPVGRPRRAAETRPPPKPPRLAVGNPGERGLHPAPERCALGHRRHLEPPQLAREAGVERRTLASEHGGLRGQSCPARCQDETARYGDTP